MARRRSSDWYGRSKSRRRGVQRRPLKSLRSISFIVRRTGLGRSPGISLIRPPGESCAVSAPLGDRHLPGFLGDPAFSPYKRLDNGGPSNNPPPPLPYLSP